MREATRAAAASLQTPLLNQGRKFKPLLYFENKLYQDKWVKVWTRVGQRTYAPFKASQCEKILHGNEDFIFISLSEELTEEMYKLKNSTTTTVKELAFSHQNHQFIKTNKTLSTLHPIFTASDQEELLRFVWSEVVDYQIYEFNDFLQMSKTRNVQQIGFLCIMERSANRVSQVHQMYWLFSDQSLIVEDSGSSETDVGKEELLSGPGNPLRRVVESESAEENEEENEEQEEGAETNTAHWSRITSAVGNNWPRQ